MVGIDTYTLEPTYLKCSKEEKDVHQILHSSRIVTVEDLTNLSKIKSRRPFAICGVPLKIKGLLGGPVRMVVIDETGEVIDCSHELFNYPEPEYYPEPYTFTPPISRHWEPTFKPELPSIHSATRLHPFIVEGQGVRGFEHKEAYVTMGGEHYGCHVEGPFTPPEILVHLWGESHNFSKELLKKYRRMPLDKMIGEASIVDLTDQIGPEQEIEVGVLEKAGKHVRKNDIVIINTGYYEWYGATSHWGTFTPGFRIEAAEWLVHKEIKTLVVDFPGVDLNKGGYSSNRVHYLFHAHDIPIIEKVVNLWKMAAKRIFFFALPLPVCAVTAYPTHVIAFEKKST
ncbi:Kynurenine formamidase [subsurface metagenome]